MAAARDATTGPDITLPLPRECRSLLPLAFISSNYTPRKIVLSSTPSPGFHPLNIAVDNSVTTKPPPLQGYTRRTQRLRRPRAAPTTKERQKRQHLFEEEGISGSERRLSGY